MRNGHAVGGGLPTRQRRPEKIRAFAIPDLTIFRIRVILAEP